MNNSNPACLKRKKRSVSSKYKKNNGSKSPPDFWTAELFKSTCPPERLLTLIGCCACQTLTVYFLQYFLNCFPNKENIPPLSRYEQYHNSQFGNDGGSKKRHPSSQNILGPTAAIREDFKRQSWSLTKELGKSFASGLRRSAKSDSY